MGTPGVDSAWFVHFFVSVLVFVILRVRCVGDYVSFRGRYRRLLGNCRGNLRKDDASLSISVTTSLQCLMGLGSEAEKMENRGKPNCM